MKINILIILILLVKLTFCQDKIVKGTVVSENKIPIAYANIWIKNTSIGTITNSQGRFKLKIPKKYIQNSINISYIGYSTFEKEISQVSDDILVVLKNKKSKIPTVNIVADDFVESILKKAYESIADNYPTENKEYQVFYQEKLSHKDSILYIAESILQINKGSYKRKNAYGQIKIIESRKYENIIDTINRVAFAGGPYIYFSADDIKLRNSFLTPSKFRDYKYSYKGTVPFNNSKVYVINFKSKKSDLKGTLYIDKKSFAYNRILLEYSPKESGVYAKTTHVKKELEYFNMADKMYLKYIAVEFDNIDLITQKKLKINLLFITTQVKNKINIIPYKQELLLTDIYRDKLVKSTESKWKSYNVLEKDTVFLSQKYFLSEKYNKEILGIKDYILKYSKKISSSYFLGLLPVSLSPKNYSLLFFNNNKAYTAKYQSSIIDITPMFGMSVFYSLTKKHLFSYTTSTNITKKYFSSFFNIGYSYVLKFNKMGKPIFFQSSINYTRRNTGVYTGDFVGENNISLNKSTLNSNIISTYIGNKEQGVSFDFSISTSISPRFNFFISTSYFYSLKRNPTLILKESKGFFLFRKTEYVPLDDHVIFKENNIQIEKNNILPPDNIAIKIGFIYH